ncbi:enhancer of polycomb-like-domain-containing protein [Collybia nuda]|uniref:Enhancer of polycomb-like protein n=1 Tax=Collybia nuda TaxID=64659 RepID=A0A9P5YHC9_9AGAR|nr:enhancer of polycomb-like-domain-containing protein [Collybia nuda]
MPRNHHPGASTLRNRIRITNKTRLKIHHGNLDADALLIPDEDEEKHRLTNLVAGVDAEDANEHHLQAVLSAASQRNNVNANRQTRGATDKASASAAPAAYIPTPDSTGVVSNYEELYPPNRWKDPQTFVASSTTVEEACTNALASGFTYYMDERDKEWLDKNNEEARGEGTSAQGAISASNTRTSARSAKAKGKEPDVSQPVVISEDEFELVMGLFEKVTHEKTEYLHHGLETGMAFPAFSEYQDTFSSPLSPPTFESYIVPSWIPNPTNLSRLARTIYPYWKERRIERGGHRIIPTLNGDEADTLNESYICFRRREIKAVRKTRASQATSSDKLVRLQTELAYPLELAKAVLARETLKKDCAQQAQQVWEKRLTLVDLKRNFPILGDKGDEELLVDKEKPKKSESSRPIKLRAHDQGAPSRSEVLVRPKERTAIIRDHIEAALARQKEADHQWEDSVETPYQPRPAAYPSRLFKFIPPVQYTQTDGVPTRAVRLRRGRGGRMLVDRRNAGPRRIISAPRSTLFESEPTDVPMDVDQENINPEIAEETERLLSRWRFDEDDMPAVGPQGADEQDRILVDDYDSKYLRHSMTLLTEGDQQGLLTDPSIPTIGPDGRTINIIPFRLGMPAAHLMRRDNQGNLRPYIGPSMTPQMLQQQQQQGNPPTTPITPVNGTPVSMQQQMKKMPPPTALPQQMRISSNGGMRPPAVASIQGNATSHSSPPNSAALPLAMPTSSNGVNRPAMNMPHIDVAKPDLPNQSALNGVIHVPQPHPPDQSHDANVNGNGGSPPKQNPQQYQTPLTTTNGFHLTPMSNLAAQALVNNQPNPNYQNGNNNPPVLTLQQMQTLKSAFANNPAFANSQELAQRLGTIPNYQFNNLQGLNATQNMNLKLPGNRQWMGGAPQKMNVIVNGMDAQGMNGSPNLSHTVPVRSPSTNGTRPGLRMAPNGQLGTHSSPHLQHSPSPIPSALAQSQSPPRPPLTPTLARASPSLQHQQPAGSSKSGY